MKKLIAFSIIILLSGLSFSQNNDSTVKERRLQKVMWGGVVPIFANTPIVYPAKTFTPGYNFLPNVVFITKKTYHNFLYGTANNVFKTINGYKPRKELGIYLAMQKNLSSKDGYAGIGIEKFFPVTKDTNKDLTFFLFSEIGKNIGPKSSLWTFTIGMHMNLQMPIPKRKT